VRVDYGRGMKDGPDGIRLDRGRELRDELRGRLSEAAPDARIPGEDKRIRPSFALSALRSGTRVSAST
jgi:hypothetical protein